MLHEIIKNYIQGYYNMKLINDNFENNAKDKEYYITKFTNDNEYILSLRKTIIKGFYKKRLNFVVCIYINKETKNIRCTATIKAPTDKNIYNNVIPSLLWKLNKNNFNEVFIKQNKLNNIYFENDSEYSYGCLKEIEANILYNNNEESLKKIIKFINIIELYNETIYDKLIQKHTI